MEIGTKIYYEKNSGNIVLFLGDSAGDVINTTFEQDFENYEVFGRYKKNAIGLISLEFGEFGKLMGTNNRFKIDVSGKEPKLIFFYVEPETEKETVPPRTIYDDVQDLKKSTEEIQVSSAIAIAEMIEKYEKERLDNSRAMAEMIEKVEKDKTELSLAMAEMIEMMNKKEGD